MVLARRKHLCTDLLFSHYPGQLVNPSEEAVEIEGVRRGGDKQNGADAQENPDFYLLSSKELLPSPQNHFLTPVTVMPGHYLASILRFS